jgi:uncharacterized membrane protein YfcA
MGENSPGRSRFRSLYIGQFDFRLVGYFSAHHTIPSLGFVLAPAVIVCGGLGSYLGSRRFPVRTISLLLATVLIIAGLKLIFTK